MCLSSASCQQCQKPREFFLLVSAPTQLTTATAKRSNLPTSLTHEQRSADTDKPGSYSTVPFHLSTKNDVLAGSARIHKCQPPVSNKSITASSYPPCTYDPAHDIIHKTRYIRGKTRSTLRHCSLSICPQSPDHPLSGSCQPLTRALTSADRKTKKE